MTKKLLFPDLERSPAITGTDNCTCYGMIWETGKPLNPNNHDLSRLEFICERRHKGKLTDFAVSDAGCPIVSKTLKDFLDNLGVDNIDYYPATVLKKAGAEPNHDYFACNIKGMANCIDFEKSELEIEMEDEEVMFIHEVDTLVLNSKSYGTIYRLYYYERVIVLEDPLAAALASSGFTGMKIITPENWDGFAGEK
ncbi:hypothetical protein O5O45_09505 [Hahella aquimaris]|uniref:imm11 family protein n=1 Tax=Hahella sp. HNIBRBA332 TaxID=3015983 RepID=UPI00273BDE38|nr:DUF1629 domain-containing protein [Hahella sp. HNIBRBA332]WLQ16149.1 hypothetical protein O5O45_09505 [Hahella sp. HNIBRBA332]